MLIIVLFFVDILGEYKLSRKLPQFSRFLSLLVHNFCHPNKDFNMRRTESRTQPCFKKIRRELTQDGGV